MDKLKKYQHIIINLVNEYREILKRPNSEIKNEFLIDTENNHYQMVSVGWEKGRYFYNVGFHIDIIGEHVWVHQENTDLKIVQELIDLGIPKSDIVLGFLSPAMRERSDFAVA